MSFSENRPPLFRDMRRLEWLTARPVAHRGLHDATRGIIENTPSAVTAAVAGGYGIEVDLQITADGEAMVHHDDALGRLTDGTGNLASMSTAALKQVPFKATTDRRNAMLSSRPAASRSRSGWAMSWPATASIAERIVSASQRVEKGRKSPVR
jgi:glycerophosphoryl diester phosphodiesterase